VSIAESGSKSALHSHQIASFSEVIEELDTDSARRGTVSFSTTVDADQIAFRRTAANDILVSALSGLGNNTSHIHIAALIQPTSSGSEVVNEKVEVIGIVSLKLTDSMMAKATGSARQNVILFLVWADPKSVYLIHAKLNIARKDSYPSAQVLLTRHANGR
jgi:hypothetical protein